MKNQQEEKKKEVFSFGSWKKVIMAGKQKQLQEEEEEEEEVVEGQGGDSLMMGFNLLPEGCISTILSFTSPKDVIRLSLVSTTFKSASESDSVWENFIPSIYPEIISRSSSPSSSTRTTSTSLLGGVSSKKDLCCSLFDKPIIIDGGSKSFGLDKRSGKICFMLGARELGIVWGSTPRYWTWGPDDESRFPEVAELLDVCWMEISGRVETRMLSPKTMYGAYFVIKTTEHNYGLDRYPGQFAIRFVREGEEYSEARKLFLKRENMQQQQQIEFPRERGDGWMEIEMGEFYNDGEEDEEVEMRLLEISSHWKCGLIVEGMELRPKVSGVVCDDVPGGGGGGGGVVGSNTVGEGVIGEGVVGGGAGGRGGRNFVGRRVVGGGGAGGDGVVGGGTGGGGRGGRNGGGRRGNRRRRGALNSLSQIRGFPHAVDPSNGNGAAPSQVQAPANTTSPQAPAAQERPPWRLPGKVWTKWGNGSNI